MNRPLVITLAVAAFVLAVVLTPAGLGAQAPAGGGQAPAAQAAPAAPPARGVSIVNMIPIQRAHADIAGNGIKGTMDIDEFTVAGGMLERITVNVQGLPVGAHGMHIHSVGRCDGPDFATAGGHFDPGPYGNTDSDLNHPYHSGDLPNLNSSLAAGGGTNASTTVYSTRFTLSGPLSIAGPAGTSIIIHSAPDVMTTGQAGQMVGGGARIACGVIRKL